MASILVKLPNWMGDILFSYDLLYTLSMKFDRVALLTSSAHADLFKVFPIPRSVVIAHESWPNLDRDAVREIQAFRPDLGLLLTNSIGSALALRLAGVSPLYGYATEHRKILLKQSLPVPERKVHQVEYYLELLRFFNLRPVLYPMDPRERKDLSVVIHPGASKRERAWNPDRFVALADALKNKGVAVAFVSDQPVHGIDAVIKPTLPRFAQMLRNCMLFIGNDSGPLHLAQHSGTAVLGIYGPGDPMVTGPRPITRYRVVYHGYPCSPCRQRFFTECSPAPTGKPYCIETISTAEVIKSASELLGL